MMNIDLLLKSNEPWTKYHTKIDLLDFNKEDTAEDFTEMENHPLIQRLIKKALQWGDTPFKRHNDASYPIYAISTLADFGLTKENSQIKQIAEKILSHLADDGGIQTLTNIPKAFGGSGNDTWTWIICDMPTLVYSLYSFGYEHHPAVIKAVELIKTLVRDNGWGCSCHPDLGKFKGPGNRGHACPIVNIYTLKVLSLLPDCDSVPEAEPGLEMLLKHWEERGKVKYYLFGIGTDYKKLKYPYVWYNILHAAEVLSRFRKAKEDKRFKEMLDVLLENGNENEMFTASSMYRSWKEWSFSNKKEPSPWLSFLVHRIKKRCGLW